MVLENSPSCVIESQSASFGDSFVSEPSTPGAFMMSEGKEISEAEINSFFNKSDRVDRVFNDILSWEDE